MQKKLYKVNEGKMLDGVCGGIGEYFDIDPTLIRLLWLFAVIVGGTGVVAYIVAAVIMPRKPEGSVNTSANNTSYNTTNTNTNTTTETKTEVYEENVVKRND